MTANDLDLLNKFARENSQDAFTEIVRRHVDLVYSAALRQVRSRPLAEEIAQSVFADLAREVGQLKPDTILTAWLYTVTRRTALNALRNESRRRLREQIAVEMNNMNATANEWTEIEPLLDDAMAALDEADRTAVLLRYFENKSLREVGEALGASEDAAQKRVSRAVERLREFFSRRNVAVGASGLAVLISANAVQSAPIGLAAAISAAAVLAGTTVSTSTAIATTKVIAMTTLQKTIIGTALVATVGTGVFEAHQASQLREKNQTLQQQQAPLAEQIRQLQRERDDATNRLAGLLAENAQLQSDQKETELLKLRGEVTRLRNDSQNLARLKAAEALKANDPMEIAAKTLLGKEELLKQQLEQMPDKNIPELQYLDAGIWAQVAQSARLDTDAGISRALSSLRDIAKQLFVPRMGKALLEYVQANNGQLPTDVSQLKPYFTSPVDDATLARYKMIETGNVADLQSGAMIVAERAQVDDDYDNLFKIGLGNWESQGIGIQKGESGAGSWSSGAPSSTPQDPSAKMTVVGPPK